MVFLIDISLSILRDPESALVRIREKTRRKETKRKDLKKKEKLDTHVSRSEKEIRLRAFGKLNFLYLVISSQA